MGAGIFLFILVFLPVLGLGAVIGYFIGKAKAPGASAHAQATLAQAWQEGYDAATTAGATGPHTLAPPAEHAAPVEPATSINPVLPAPPPPPTAYQQLPAQPSAQPNQPQLSPRPNAQPSRSQPVVLSPQQLAAKRERDQIRNANILLYVAALLMVGTGMLFVAAGFPAIATISVLAIVTFGFYGAGLLLNKTTRRLRGSGTAFTGTGLALYPVFALAAATQLWPGSSWPWLVFSLIGAVAFSVAAAVLNSRVVAFLTLPFLLSMSISAGAVLRSGMVWSFVFTIMLATIISWFAAERPRWVNNIFIQAFVTTHEYIVPATLATQIFLFTKMTDLQNTLIFGAALLYYVTRSVLALPKRKLYYFTAARVLFLLTLWQVLRAFNVAGSTIATIMALAIAVIMLAVLVGQQRYATLLQRSERTERFAANWLRADLGSHALALVSLSIGTEATIDPDMFGKGDWAVLNLPVVITMITFVAIILIHQRYAHPSWWAKTVDSPLWFLAVPFWLARSGNSNYGAEFFRTEVFWILGLIGFGVVFIKRRYQAIPQLAMAAIAGTVLYLATRTHMGVADISGSWQSSTILIALWSLLAVIWLYAVAKLARWGAVEPAQTQAQVSATSSDGFLPRVGQRFTFSHRLVGYAAAGVAAILLWSSLSAGRADAVTEPAQQQTLYYLSIVLVLAIVVSFGLILLRNLRRAPDTSSTHIALWSWALLGLVLGVRERLFLTRLDPESINWFSLAFGLVLVVVIWLAGHYTAKLNTESAKIRARWYQTAAILGLGYALYHGLSLLKVSANLLFGIPFIATLGYFVVQAIKESVLTQQPVQGTSASEGNERYRRHVLISAGLLLIMPLFLLLQAESPDGELNHRELYRWLVLAGWVLFTAVVLLYATRRVFGYLPVAAVGVYGTLSVATQRSAWAGESGPSPYLNADIAGWISIVAGISFIMLMIIPHVYANIRQRWGSAALWAPLLSHLIMSFAAINLNNNGYIWTLVGLGLAAGMVLASHHENAWALRPIAVPVIFLAMIPLAEELHWDLAQTTNNDLPVWLIVGFLGAALSYLIGLFYTVGAHGKQAAHTMRIAALAGFLIFMVYGWTDTKAALVFAVLLTLVALLGLGLEQRGGTRRTFVEISLLTAVLGAQRIWSDAPGNEVDQRMGFWFQQHVVLAMVVLAVLAHLSHSKARVRPNVPTQQAAPAPAHPVADVQPVGRAHSMHSPALPAGSQQPPRFNGYLYAAATLLSIASLWLFGLANAGVEFSYTIVAFVALIVYGAMKSRTGMLIWGIAGTILVLFLFLNVGSFLLLFLLALALMGVGIWQLIRITQKPDAPATTGPAPFHQMRNQPPYNQAGAYGSEHTSVQYPPEPRNQPPQSPPTH